MKVFVYTTERVAAESHREMKEEIEVDINDTIDNVKLKVTLIYTELDP
jgi:hypothetical protein